MPRMRCLLFSIACIACAVSSPTAYAEPIRFHLKWQYSDIATRMEVYEPRPRPRQRVWKMHTVDQWSRVPVAARLDDDAIDVEPGKARRVVLVMRNDSDKPVRFTAATHESHPPGGAKPRFRFKCLCVHKTFEIGPRQIWYRVVELRTAQEVVDKEITLTHWVMGVNS